MNGNSSKQVLLSVLGIAILVVAVVGVSFAFFSYTKTGNSNNTIRTGQIYTYLTEGDNIQLVNALPLATDLTAGTMANTTGDSIGALQFTVTGMNQSETDINYAVYLSKGAELTYDHDGNGSTAEVTRPRLADSDMRLIMSTTGGTIDNGLTSPQLISTLTQADGQTPGSMDTGNILIAHGTFGADNGETANTQVNHTYLINLYVDKNVKISDTDTQVNGQPTRYCAHHTVGTPETTTSNAEGGNYGCELYDDNGGATVVPITCLPSGKS